MQHLGIFQILTKRGGGGGSGAEGGGEGAGSTQLVESCSKTTLVRVVGGGRVGGPNTIIFISFKILSSRSHHNLGAILEPYGSEILWLQLQNPQIHHLR